MRRAAVFKALYLQGASMAAPTLIGESGPAVTPDCAAAHLMDGEMK